MEVGVISSFLQETIKVFQMQKTILIKSTSEKKFLIECDKFTDWKFLV